SLGIVQNGPRLTVSLSRSIMPLIIQSIVSFIMDSPGRLVLCLHWPVHHLQHLGTTSLQEPPQENSGQEQEGDVEPRRVVPGDCRRLDHLCVMLTWNETSNSEYALHDQGGSEHRNVERGEEKYHHPPAVVFPVNV